MRLRIDLLMLSLAVVLAACSGPIGTEPDRPDSEADEPDRSSAKPCEPAEFAPTYLPWQGSGPIPKPERYKNRKDVILVWFGPAPKSGPEDAPHVDLTTTYENNAEDTGTTMQVLGTEGFVSWNAEFSEMAVRWTERDEPCGHYGLFVTDPLRSKAWHETELARVVESLE